MQHYTSRRKRSWVLLKELDPKLEISDEQRADLLLDLSGLPQNERLLIMSSIANARDFDKIADALAFQHSRQHEKEVRNTNKGRGKNNKGKGRGNHNGKGKGWRPHNGKGNKKGKMTANYVETAYLADDYDYDYDYDCAYYGDETEKAELQNNPERPDSDEEIENAANNADHEDETEYVESLEEQIELDAVAFIVDQDGE